MFGIKKRFSNMGKVSKGTNHEIDEAIEKQQEIKKSWSKRRPTTLAVSNPKGADDASAAAEKKEPIAVLPKTPSAIFNDDSKNSNIWSYWFPMVCAAAVISVAIWTFWPKSEKLDGKSGVPDPIVRTVDTEKHAVEKTATAPTKPAAMPMPQGLPAFDAVRIESNGNIVIAGRARANDNVSVQINGRIHATLAANKDGEFVYTPKNKMKPGNYTVQLIAGNQKSARVFLYIDQKPEQSLSLLMTKDTSKVLQAPTPVQNSAFTVSKIDYLENGRLVIQGKGLPRLRVTTTMNDRQLGMTRVSSHKNFGLGAQIGSLTVGETYRLAVKMHDAQNNVVSEIMHEFTMPKMTGNKDTFYVVRRGDSLWIIARNFNGNGFQFTAIAAANNIENPDIIHPKQKLKIPVRK